MKDNNWIEKLKEEGSCPKAIDWASDYKTPQAAWSACERADWMLWAWSRNCGKIGSKSHRRLVLCAVECARTDVKYIKDKEEVKKLVKKSLDTTERWARGEEGVTLEDVKSTADATADATAAAGAAGYAGYAADAAAIAAAAAGYAADAADAATAIAAREKALKECADIIRTIQPDCPEFKMVTV